MPETSGAVCFSDEALARILAALRLAAPPARVALLPELLRAWAKEDLREHLAREGRSADRVRREKLAAVATKASDLLNALLDLDEEGRFTIACEAHTRREAGNSIPHPDLWWPDDIEGAERRRDEALAWLTALIDAIGEPREKPPPDKRTLSYLVVVDLAAIFELVTCTKPTRRNNAYAKGPQAYGPFWDFVNCVCGSLKGVRSIDRAIKDLVLYPREHSLFVANLQFRHPDLWQKLRRYPQ